LSIEQDCNQRMYARVSCRTINMCKCATFAGIAGDITPYCGVSEEEKRRREATALDQIAEILGDCPARDQIRRLWEEYEAGETGEAKLVKDFDKVCRMVQCCRVSYQFAFQFE